MPFLFTKLEVYQKALDFTEAVCARADTFSRPNWALADQLRRAAISIPTNIAEGNGRWHVADRRHFFHIARGSACECVPLLELCARRRLLSPEQHEQMNAAIDSLAQMLTALAASNVNR